MNFASIIPRETHQSLTRSPESLPLVVLLHGALWHAALEDHLTKMRVPMSAGPIERVTDGNLLFMPSHRPTQADWRIFKDESSATQAEQPPDVTDRNRYLSIIVDSVWARFGMTPYRSTDGFTFSLHQMEREEEVHRRNDEASAFAAALCRATIKTPEDWQTRLATKLKTMQPDGDDFRIRMDLATGQAHISWHRQPEVGLLGFKERPAKLFAQRGTRP